MHSGLQSQFNWIPFPCYYLLTRVKTCADLVIIVSYFPLEGDLETLATCPVDGDLIDQVSKTVITD